MNQSLLLHVVERLEGVVTKLPGGIQKAILSELKPLKELFLEQRPPRFLFCGSADAPLPQVIDLMFAPATPFAVVAERFRWQRLHLPERGSISVLDARQPASREIKGIDDELRREPPDVIVYFGAGGDPAVELHQWLNQTTAKIVGVTNSASEANQLMEAFNREADLRDRSLGAHALAPGERSPALMSVLSAQMPNPARIEMLRISPDRAQQHHVAGVLIRSTTAICTAIGAQPIPLADMPILTSLQLVMVSAIMYISGRERSLRAATEFVGALGANLGAGMLLREGARALLKFLPGWGNVVSGMVAGAGTYAIGRAASAYFLDNVTLKAARQTYRLTRRRSRPPELPDIGASKAARPGTNGSRRSRRTKRRRVRE